MDMSNTNNNLFFAECLRVNFAYSYQSVIETLKVHNFIMKFSVIKFCPINFSIIIMHYVSKPKHIKYMYMHNIATYIGACTFVHSNTH